MREEVGVQRHNVNRGCNSVQLLFKIYYSLLAGFLSLPGGLTVAVVSLLQLCVYTASVMITLRSHPIYLCYVVLAP